MRIFSSQAVPIAQSPFFLAAPGDTIAEQHARYCVVAGLDLNPIGVSDPAQAGWLEALVWPEQTDRLANLRAADKIATTVKPLIARGNLREIDVKLGDPRNERVWPKARRALSPRARSGCAINGRI